MESFAGQLTNFDVWKKLLTPAEIEILYGACDPGFGNFISWINLLQNINGDIMVHYKNTLINFFKILTI